MAILPAFALHVVCDVCKETKGPIVGDDFAAAEEAAKEIGFRSARPNVTPPEVASMAEPEREAQLARLARHVCPACLDLISG